MKVIQLKDGRWVFDSGEIRGKRIRTLFDTQSDAEAKMRKAKEIAKEEGQKILVEWLSIMGNELAELIAYRRAMIDVNGKPLWKQGHELHMAHLTAKKSGGLLRNLLDDYIQRKRKAGRNADYIDRLERELGVFVDAHAKLTAVEVTDKHIDAFLDKLGLGQITRANRIRDLSGLFNYAKKRNLCSVNPADMTEPIKIVKKRIKSFDLREVAVILWVADHHPEWELIPYIGFNLWGSSRVSESFRLDWCEYVPEESALIFEAAATKPNQERVTEDLPPILLDWIGPYVKESGSISPPETTVEWRRANYLIPAIQAVLPSFIWYKNGLRKTSISADYAVSKDANSVAAKHGTSTEMLFKNYRKVMRAATAAQFFQLTRANITTHLRGLVPDNELDAWDRKYAQPMTALDSSRVEENQQNRTAENRSLAAPK